MVKRIILWKIKNEQNNQANLDLIKEGLLSLKNSINEIVSVEVGLNYSSDDFDIVFIVAFDTPFSLKQLQLNPEFQKVFQMVSSISNNMVSCDFMIETSSSNSNPLNNNNGKRETLATSASPNDSAFSLPFNNNQNNQNPSPTPMGGGAYGGFGNANGESNGVNFTTSENVNQIKFSNTFGGQASSVGGQTPAIGNNDSWRCTKCGKTNSSFINMCSCGKRKPTENMPNMNPSNINKNIIQPQQNGMMINTGLVPKMPASPINSTFAKQMGGTNPENNWICPSCGKSNNDFMKVCICGHRKVEKGSSNNLPAYGPGNSMNKPMMPLPNNPGGNNVKSPNNNEFFNSFGNNNGPTPGGRPINNSPGGPMGGPPGGGPMGGPPGSGPMGGPPGGRPMGGPPGGGPMGGPPGNRPMGGPTPGNRPMGGPPPQGRPIGGNPSNGRPMGGPTPGNRPMGGPSGGRPMGGPPGGGPMGGPPGGSPTPPDSWKCPRCGKVLGNFVGQCICGQRKPSRTNMQF